MHQYSSIADASPKPFLSDLVARNQERVSAENDLESEPVKFEGAIEDLILGCSDGVWAMAWSFARSSDGRLEAEDLYSAAMLGICECVAAGYLARANAPEAYLLAVARTALVREWRRMHEWKRYGYSFVSLDAPLFSSDGDSLQDVLASPVPVPVTPMKEKERAVCSAVERLSPRRRAVVSLRFGLGEYTVHTPHDSSLALGLTPDSELKLKKRGLIDLGRDAELCAAVLEVVQ